MHINVAYITDSQYVVPTCVSIYSLIENALKTDMLTIYVISDRLSNDERRKIKSCERNDVTINLIDVDGEEYKELSLTCKYASHTHVTPAALFKFNLPDIINEDKVIYIDGDTVIQHSLCELYATNIEDYYVAAVDDMMDTKEDGKSYLARSAGLLREHYFNSGVMLLNLAKMRTDKIAEALITYRTKKNNNFMDQDTLNAVLGERRICLSYKYNFMSTVVDVYELNEINDLFMEHSKRNIDECIESAVILHLTDKKKPWIYNMPWYSDIFLRYYNRLPFETRSLKLKSPLKVLYEEKKYLKQRINSILQNSEMVFPYNKIDKGSNIVLYGAGKIGKSLKKQVTSTSYCSVILWVDRRGQDAGDEVEFPEAIKGKEFDFILIAIGSVDISQEVCNMLINTYGVEKNKLVTIT